MAKLNFEKFTVPTGISGKTNGQAMRVKVLRI